MRGREGLVSVSVDRSNINEFVHAPGVAILYWRHSKDPRSLLFDPVFEHTRRENPDVRFGQVDTWRERDLVLDWDIADVPALMAYRDGILIFHQPGTLPPSLFENLIQAIWSLDMADVREGMDGHGARVALVVRPGADPAIEVAENGGTGSTGRPGS